MRCVIDPSGMVWKLNEASAWVQDSTYPGPSSPQELTESLVVGRGYIGLIVRGDSAQVFFNRHLMRYAPLEAAIYKLQRNVGGIVISAGYGQGQWDVRLHPTCQDAIGYILLLAERHRNQPRDRFDLESLDRFALKRSNTPALAKVVDIVRSHDWEVQDDVLAKLSRMVRHRFMVCEKTPAVPRWSIRQIGGGYNYLNTDLLGSPYISDHSHRGFGRWAEGQYDRVWATGEPAADNVDITLSMGRGHLRRNRYRRVLIPLQSSGGRQLLLNASIYDSSINLSDEY